MLTRHVVGVVVERLLGRRRRGVEGLGRGVGSSEVVLLKVVLGGRVRVVGRLLRIVVVLALVVVVVERSLVEVVGSKGRGGGVRVGETLLLERKLGVERVGRVSGGRLVGRSGGGGLVHRHRRWTVWRGRERKGTRRDETRQEEKGRR